MPISAITPLVGVTFMRFSKIKALILSLLLLGGCDSGIDCPLDPPDCCYDVLFGCQLFDMPMGCSCSQYGLGFATSAKTAPRKKALTTTPANRLSGNWSGNLKQSSSSCRGVPKSISGRMHITQRKNKVSIEVPQYGKLRGKVAGRRGFAVVRRYALPIPLCNAFIEADMRSNKPGVGAASAQVNVYCGSEKLCSASYNGALIKQ